MKITLKDVYILEDNITQEDAVFAHLIDNSFAEWNVKWKNQELEKEEIGWKATFEIEFEDKTGEFSIDTQGEYLTHLDLEGYLGGESLELDEDIHLKIASQSSGILTALYYSEASRYGVLRERVEKALYYTIFPEWTRGLVAENVDELEGVKEFLENFQKVFEKLDILKKVKIDMEDYNVNGGNGVLQEAIRAFIPSYFNKEIFFFVHDADYVGNLRELQEAGATLNIDTSIVDEYE